MIVLTVSAVETTRLVLLVLTYILETPGDGPSSMGSGLLYTYQHPLVGRLTWGVNGTCSDPPDFWSIPLQEEESVPLLYVQWFHLWYFLRLKKHRNASLIGFAEYSIKFCPVLLRK